MKGKTYMNGYRIIEIEKNIETEIFGLYITKIMHEWIENDRNVKKY